MRKRKGGRKRETGIPSTWNHINQYEVLINSYQCHGNNNDDDNERDDDDDDVCVCVCVRITKLY